MAPVPSQFNFMPDHHFANWFLVYFRLCNVLHDAIFRIVIRSAIPYLIEFMDNYNYSTPILIHQSNVVEKRFHFLRRKTAVGSSKIK